jgi:membrane protein
VWEVERPPAWRAWPLRLGLTVLVLVLLALALLLLVLTGRLASAVGDAVGLGTATVELYGVLKWPALLVIVVALVGLLYRVSPTGARPRPWWQILTPGGATAVAVWTIGSAGFEVYVDRFSAYDTVYGALGTTIAALVWLWLTNLVLLAGVELDAALELSRGPGAASQPS